MRLPCQDAHKWTVVSGFLVGAVADGAGSAPLAEVGAAVASSAAAEFGRERLAKDLPSSSMGDQRWVELLTETLAFAKRGVEAEAGLRSLPVGDLATTLITLIAGPGFVAAAQIGDGAVVAADRAGAMVSVTAPGQGEYLNETTFLTSTEALASARSAVWRGDLAHLAMLSDGLQMAALKMPAGDPHPGFFKPLFDFIDQRREASETQVALAGFLTSPRLRERTDDDVTLVLASLAL